MGRGRGTETEPFDFSDVIRAGISEPDGTVGIDQSFEGSSKRFIKEALLLAEAIRAGTAGEVGQEVDALLRHFYGHSALVSKLASKPELAPAAVKAADALVAAYAVSVGSSLDDDALVSFELDRLVTKMRVEAGVVAGRTPEIITAREGAAIDYHLRWSKRKTLCGLRIKKLAGYNSLTDEGSMRGSWQRVLASTDMREAACRRCRYAASGLSRTTSPLAIAVHEGDDFASTPHCSLGIALQNGFTEGLLNTKEHASFGDYLGHVYDHALGRGADMLMLGANRMPIPTAGEGRPTADLRFNRIFKRQLTGAHERDSARMLRHISDALAESGEKPSEAQWNLILPLRPLAAEVIRGGQQHEAGATAAIVARILFPKAVEIVLREGELHPRQFDKHLRPTP